MNYLLNPLRLNIGFILKQSIGYSRDFLFDYTQVKIEKEIELAFLKGSAQVSRTPQGLLTDVYLSTSMSVECVRCLDPFSLPIETWFTELFAFSERTVAESGLILPRDGHLDLNPLAREYLWIEVPINPICQPDCKGLCVICGENLNYTNCQHEEEITDPRLELLKKLRTD